MRRLIVAFILSGSLLFAQDKPTPKKIPVAVTQEKLQQRIEELKAQREQAIANANAYAGAIQECEYWITQIKTLEEEKEKPLEKKK